MYPDGNKGAWRQRNDPDVVCFHHRAGFGAMAGA